MVTKILSLIISVVMLLTSVPLGGVADELGVIISSIIKNSADSVDGSVESLGQEAEDFIVTENASGLWVNYTSPVHVASDGLYK